MVSTRKHPKNYPPPEAASETSAATSNAGSTPAVKKTASRSTARSKSRPRVSTVKANASATVSPAPESPGSPTTAVTRTRPSRARASASWSHTPSHLTLIWLALSLPLVIWDSLYVLGRPHTMPGGKWHKPLFTPYALYGQVDGIYGFKAINAKNGFTSAQGFLNVIETALYMAYLYVVYKNGKEQEKTTSRGRRKSVVEGRGAPSKKLVGWLGEARLVNGAPATAAVLAGFTGAIMTLSKTILYGLNEYFSGYDNVGHNALPDLLLLWIIPNGAWIVGSTYMTYAFGAEIIEGLNAAGGASVPKVIATKEE